ncbi:MAG: DUF4129 domain-containing protein [Dehalococcoidales bacterium]|nr:MAG: DUF4129 domain-containing protein [Dehalococcoidales bacterium]
MVMVTRLLNLNWIVTALAPLAVILMEVFWVYPWLVWLGKWQKLVWNRPPLSLASLVFLVGVSFLATRYFRSRPWPVRWVRLSIIASGLLAAFLVLRFEYGAGFSLLSGQWFVHTADIVLDSFSNTHPVVLALPAAAYLWWRGIHWGNSTLYFGDIYRSFINGITALVALIIIWGFSMGFGTLAGLASTVGIHVAGFFFFGLMALALGHLRGIQQRMLREESGAVFSRRWLFIVIGVVAVIVLLGVGVASIFSTEFVSMLGEFFGAIFDLLRQAIYYIFIPIGYLVEGLVRMGQFFISLIRRGSYDYPTANFTDPGELPVAASTQGIPEGVILGLKWAFFVIIAAVVVFLLIKVISRIRPFRAEVGIEEIHESLWSWQGLKTDLLLYLSTLWSRFRPKKRVEPESGLPEWYLGEDFEGVLGIREIYRHLLFEASSSGKARRNQETPYEYARRLEKALPEGVEPVGGITDLYVEVRYGDIEAGDMQVNNANSLWRTLRRLLKGPAEEESV